VEPQVFTDCETILYDAVMTAPGHMLKCTTPREEPKYYGLG
jgi:hypothetical protein